MSSFSSAQNHYPKRSRYAKLNNVAKATYSSANDDIESKATGLNLGIKSPPSSMNLTLISLINRIGPHLGTSVPCLNFSQPLDIVMCRFNQLSDGESPAQGVDPCMSQFDSRGLDVKSVSSSR